jgi:hypothetical protein
MEREQGTMTPDHLNLSNFAVQLDGLAQKLQHVSFAIQEAATVLRSSAAMHAESMLKADSDSQIDAMRQELAEIKGQLGELVSRFQPMPEEPTRAVSPPLLPAAKSRRRRRSPAIGRSPEIGWNISSKLMEALADATTRHGFPHRRALVGHFLELYRRQRAGRDMIVQCLDEHEPKLGPRKRLHFRGLMSYHLQQIFAEAARADVPEHLFVAGLCWWGLSLLTSGEATPKSDGNEMEA